MSFFLGRRTVTAPLGALLGTLLAVGLVAAPAQANPRSPDPELPLVVASAPRTAGPAHRATAAVDSDVYAYASSPTSIYFVVAGRLKLHLRSGSTTKYVGSLIDYTGNTSYAASADATNPDAPTLKLKNRNGTFAFVSNSSFGTSYWSGIATKIPAKLKVPANQVYLGASPHSASSRTYGITLTERSGAINDPFEYVGTLTVVYDANSRISGGSVTVSNSKGKNVTHSLTSSGYSSSSSFYTAAKLDKTTFGIAGTISGSSLTGYGFAAHGSTTTLWVLSGTA